MSNFKDIEKTITHPLEETFDIQENTTQLPVKKADTDLVKVERYDDKDSELDEQFQAIHDAAFEAFENQAEDAELVDPKYKARNAEVAVQYLNTALQAVSQKLTLKQHSDKTTLAASKGPSTVNNNLIVDRNQVLKMFEDEEKKALNTVNAVDGEFDEIPNETERDSD